MSCILHSLLGVLALPLSVYPPSPPPSVLCLCFSLSSLQVRETMHHPCQQVITSSAWRSSKDCQALSLAASAVGLQQKEAVSPAQLLPTAEQPLHRTPISSLLQLLPWTDSVLHSLLRSSLQQILQTQETPYHSQSKGSFLQPSQGAVGLLLPFVMTEAAHLLSLHRAVRPLCSQWAAPVGSAEQGQAIQHAPKAAQRALQAKHKLLFQHNPKHLPWTVLQQGGRLAPVTTADGPTRSTCQAKALQ